MPGTPERNRAMARAQAREEQEELMATPPRRNPKYVPVSAIHLNIGAN